MKNITFTHQIEKDTYTFLEYHGYKEIAEHCNQVACKAERLANRFNVDNISLKIAGYLHDIGRVLILHQNLEYK